MILTELNYNHFNHFISLDSQSSWQTADSDEAINGGQFIHLVNVETRRNEHSSIHSVLTDTSVDQEPDRASAQAHLRTDSKPDTLQCEKEINVIPSAPEAMNMDSPIASEPFPTATSAAESPSVSSHTSLQSDEDRAPAAIVISAPILPSAAQPESEIVEIKAENTELKSKKVVPVSLKPALPPRRRLGPRPFQPFSTFKPASKVSFNPGFNLKPDVGQLPDTPSSCGSDSGFSSLMSNPNSSTAPSKTSTILGIKSSSIDSLSTISIGEPTPMVSFSAPTQELSSPDRCQLEDVADTNEEVNAIVFSMDVDRID